MNEKHLLLLLLMPVLFSQPIPFAEALERREVQSLLPTTLSSAELAEISPDLLERSFFSARVAHAELLQKLAHVLDRYLSGELDLASARLEIKQFLAQIGYQAAPPDEGTLKDLRTDERINLILRMNAESAQGYGYWTAAQSHLVQWPCQEVLRVGYRRTHRQWSGLDRGEIIKDEPTEGRWQEHGGQLYDGRMIALLNDPIWTNINRFGVPYPPFDFNSGMGVAGVNRQDAIALGVIGPDDPPQDPQTRDFNQDLKFSTAIREAALRQALEEFGYHFEGDVLTP